VISIQSYAHGISGIHAANPGVKVRIVRDAEQGDEPVLVVDYPPPTNDPAGRDVWCDSEKSDWTPGSALSFHVKAVNPERLSLSFVDRNGVAYTTWIDLKGGVWQAVRISFDQLRPNPYFQPPGARTGAPIDVSEVKSIAFAPHNQASGQLMLTQFVVTK
jgi:Carbohydrate binding domain (family 11)